MHIKQAAMFSYISAIIGQSKRNYTQQDVNLHKDTRNDEKLPGTFAMHTEEQLKHNMFKEAVAR